MFTWYFLRHNIRYNVFEDYKFHECFDELLFEPVYNLRVFCKNTRNLTEEKFSSLNKSSDGMITGFLIFCLTILIVLIASFLYCTYKNN